MGLKLSICLNQKTHKRNRMNTFDLSLYQDGMPSKFGSENNIGIDDTIESLLYYNIVSDIYSEAELTRMLTDMQIGFQHYQLIGDGLIQIKIIKRRT